MKYLAGLFMLLLTANAHARGEINCSSANSYIRLIDSEIWEYGSLSYSISHPEETKFQVSLNESSKRLLHINDQNRAYAIEAEVVMREGSLSAKSYFWLICEQWNI